MECRRRRNPVLPIRSSIRILPFRLYVLMIASYCLRIAVYGFERGTNSAPCFRERGSRFLQLGNLQLGVHGLFL